MVCRSSLNSEYRLHVGGSGSLGDWNPTAAVGYTFSRRWHWVYMLTNRLSDPLVSMLRTLFKVYALTILRVFMGPRKTTELLRLLALHQVA